MVAQIGVSVVLATAGSPSFDDEGLASVAGAPPDPTFSRLVIFDEMGNLMGSKSFPEN